MPIANIKPVGSIYEYQMHEWQNDLSGVQLQLEEDKTLLSSYKDQKSETIQIGMAIKNQIINTINELENTKNDLEKELQEFAGIVWDEFTDHAGRSAEDIFNEIFEPFMQALTPLMDLVGSVGLPEVPIIGNLQAIIQKIAKTGQLISRLPKEVREAARKEADEQKKLEKERRTAEAEAAEAERKYKQVDQNMSWWDRQKDDFRNSPFGKIILEIVEIFTQVIHVVWMICQCSVYAALLMLLEKLKPLLSQLGDIIALISNAFSVMKMLMLSSAQMIRFFYKVLEEKLSELWNVVRYVIDGGWSMPINGMISAVYADMICCEFEISSINMEMGRISIDHNVDLDEDKIKEYEKRIKSLEGNLESAKAEDPRDASKIMTLTKMQRKTKENKAFALLKLDEDKAAYDSMLADIDSFKETAPDQYTLELQKRTAADEFLQNSHKEIKEINEKNKAATGAARVNAARTRRKTIELKEQKRREQEEKEAKELEERRANGLPT